MAHLLKGKGKLKPHTLNPYYLSVEKTKNEEGDGDSLSNSTHSAVCNVSSTFSLSLHMHLKGISGRHVVMEDFPLVDKLRDNLSKLHKLSLQFFSCIIHLWWNLRSITRLFSFTSENFSKCQFLLCRMEIITRSSRRTLL